jgi:methylenetetrahydrofolate dehydrogenase (NADP+)/methenyltetrahydrofolate cyclohydrolase
MEQYKVNIREIDIISPHSCFEEMSKLISNLNQNANISGILFQLPLQPLLKPYTKELIELIDPLKDVDCLTLTNRAKIIEHTSMQVMPCTPSAVLKILD